MKVPLLDLKPQYQSIKSEIDSAIARVVASQHFILGPEVEALEKEVAAYLGCRDAVALSSGSDALLASLMALDVGHGDEVIVPDYSFFATAGVVSRLGARPVFCDIDPVTFNLDPVQMKRLIGRRTRSIIPVHLYGQAADMGAIGETAKASGLPVIEDAAQAIGACYRDGRPLGTIGAIGCFSFFPTKNLGGFGDGGLAVTNDPALGDKLRVLRVHGSKVKYIHHLVGGNFRLDALQAAVLRVKLPHLAGWTAGRRRNAALYTRLFVESGLAEGSGHLQFDRQNRVLLPKAIYEGSPLNENPSHVCPTYFHIYNQYVIRVESRDELKKFLAEKEIGTEIYYPIPFHEQDCFNGKGAIPESPKRKSKSQPTKGTSASAFPESTAAARTSLALPIYPELSEEQIGYVVGMIGEFQRTR